MLNFTKKLFSLYTCYIIFEGGVGGQKNLKFFYFVFSLIFVPKGIQIHLGRLTFLKKSFFEPPYSIGPCLLVFTSILLCKFTGVYLK